MNQNLSVALREGTATQHVAAENAPFARVMAAGDATIADYAALLGQLAHVYGAIEAGATALRDHPQAGPFVDVRLHRVDAIRADLAALGTEASAPLEETAAYAARVSELVTAWPVGWVAHHYTRYLGDLSGGQILARALRKTHGDAVGGALGFFSFEGIGAPGAYKQAYRAKLDALGERLDADEHARLIAEAGEAFAHNQAMFRALDERDQVRA